MPEGAVSASTENEHVIKEVETAVLSCYDSDRCLWTDGVENLFKEHKYRRQKVGTKDTEVQIFDYKDGTIIIYSWGDNIPPKLESEEMKEIYDRFWNDNKAIVLYPVRNEEERQRLLSLAKDVTPVMKDLSTD